MLRKWGDHDTINNEAAAVLASVDCDTAETEKTLASINARWDDLQKNVKDSSKTLRDAQEHLRELTDVLSDVTGALDKQEDKMDALQANGGDRNSLDKLRVSTAAKID